MQYVKVIILALFLAPSLTFANIYDTATSYDPIYTASCTKDGQGMRQVLSLKADENFQTKLNLYTGQYSVRNRTFHSYDETFNDAQGTCSGQLSESVEIWITNPSTSYLWQTQSIGDVQTGQIDNLPTCPSAENNEAIHSGQKTDGSPFCYTTFDLETADSCGYGNALLPSNNTGNITACFTKPDNSQCLYNLSEQDGQQFYEPSLEPSACYGGQHPTYAEISISEPPADGCADIGNGTSVCPEDPANVCGDSGCQSGCGTVEFGSGEQFICFSKDTDNDGIGDYADPDIDGDGIGNADDFDYDGDGQQDPTYSNPGINGNGSPGSATGNGSSGNTVVNVDLAPVTTALEDIKDSFQVEVKEKGTFETTEEIDTEIAAAEQELSDLIDAIKAESEALISITVPSKSGFGCYDTASLKGQKFQSCADQFNDELNIIGIVFTFIFALISIVIIIRN